MLIQPQPLILIQPQLATVRPITGQLDIRPIAIVRPIAEQLDYSPIITVRPITE